ncbi:hypothetical protein TRICI_005954 [Trichomonascus ciferrii]|uniref:P/Homo B domain-containing protein n=1 Tax=Trichomonascus ciferrii TaxID=44093 RepID=A0A642UMU0_9ASCO|nr:hypothetical protein TRICI_005954 [Trichomonascus ciferrii]
MVPVRPRDYDSRIYYAVELAEGVDPEVFAQVRGRDWTFEQPLGSLKGHYLYSVPRDSEAGDLVRGIRDRPVEQARAALASEGLERRAMRALYKRELLNDGVKSLQVLEEKRLYKRYPVPAPVDSSYKLIEEAQDRLNINDPEFPRQWHLINPGQPGHDLNITGVWYQNVTGKGVRVAVVDDGVDLDHDDIKDNYFAEGSYDFNDDDPVPRPELSDDRHGTRCAGEIAAVKNDNCGLGVAYDSKVAGLRILSGRISEVDEALALNYAMDQNDIYSCSWGPPDNGQAVAEPGMVVRKAMINGVLNGRDKKGSIFVFASGNGAGFGDNCNFDGYTNSIYSITVAAIDRKGLHPFYSESCSANLVVTYSSGSGDHIHTTDFHGGCTDNHGGTSAAAPIAAGVFALVLEVRPDLTWRDMQTLAMEAALPVNENDPDWQETYSGRLYNHKYGYGKIDAYGIIERAKSYELIKPQSWYFSKRIEPNAKIGYGKKKGAKSTVNITQEDLDAANFEKVEHVNVFLNLGHQRRGSLTIVLTSPEGVKSRLAEPRFADSSSEGLVGWTFMSVAHWGEPGVGEWTLEAYNDEKEDVEGVLLDWRLKLWGEAKDADKAFPYPVPEEEDPDPDHRPSAPAEAIKPIKPSKTASIVPTKTPETRPPKASSAATKPTSGAATSSTAKPSGTKSADKTTSPTPSDTSKPWSLIPTFGLSNNTIAWVYGSLLLILGFLCGITTYICISRRRRRQRDNAFKHSAMPSYEFDLIPPEGEDDEDEDDNDESRRLYDPDDSGIYSPEDSLAYEDGDDNQDTKGAMSAGQKAKTLYDAYTKKGDSPQASTEDVFRVHDEDDDENIDDNNDDDKKALLK